MSVPKESGLVFELGFVLAIYFAFIFTYFLFIGAFRFVYYQFGYIVVGVLATIISVYLYRAARRKQIAPFYVIFTIVGVTILAASTVIASPHVTTESYSYGGLPSTSTFDLTRTFASYYNTSDEFGPLYTRLFLNFSILRIRVFTTGAFVLKMSEFIFYQTYGNYTLVLSERVGNMSRSGLKFKDYYWTPNGPMIEYPDGSTFPLHPHLYENSLSFEFENLENSPITVHCQVDTYPPEITEQREVTNYRPVIDSSYVYVGFGFLAAAVVIESGALARKKPLGNKPTNA